jgi:osmoprotectant transport system permease protein
VAGFWNYLSGNLDALAGHALGHLYVVAIGLALSSVLGIAIGMLTYRNPTARSWALNSTAVILTIPSLALFAIMLTMPPPIGGLGAKPVIIGLALYGLLPIVRNTIVGLNEVDQSVVESALGMGMTRWQRLVRIEAPMAWPVIVTGIRVSGLIMVAIATVGAIVNGPGFGKPLLQALARIGSVTATPQAVVATICVILFGIALDGLFRLLVHYTTPRGIRG